MKFGVHENGELVASDNWDAFFDSMKLLEEGGIYGKGEKINFPLKLKIKGLADFKAASPDDFVIFKDILDKLVQFYSNYNLVLDVKMNGQMKSKTYR